LIPKLQASKSFRCVNFREGIYLYVYGFFTKVVIADSIARIADSIFAMSNPSGAQVLFGAYAFALQIYCDFMGYSNMARGISHFLA